MITRASEAAAGWADVLDPAALAFAVTDLADDDAAAEPADLIADAMLLSLSEGLEEVGDEGGLAPGGVSDPDRAALLLGEVASAEIPSFGLCRSLSSESRFPFSLALNASPADHLFTIEDEGSGEDSVCD